MFLPALIAAQPQFAHGSATQDQASTPLGRHSVRNPNERPAGPSKVAEDQDPDTSAVIAPYNSAEIASETRGVIEAARFKEGNFVEKGQVIIVISKKRNELAVRRAANTVKALTS